MKLSIMALPTSPSTESCFPQRTSGPDVKNPQQGRKWGQEWGGELKDYQT